MIQYHDLSSWTIVVIIQQEINPDLEVKITMSNPENTSHIRDYAQLQ